MRHVKWIFVVLLICSLTCLLYTSSMDNVYYDNVMHICVYEGKKSLFASDITKQMFDKVEMCIRDR